MIPLWTIPIATVTGNCVVLKPSERTPTAAMLLAELAREAGLPPGVLNVVHGAARTVDFLLDAPAVRAVSFVGGNRAGEYIFARGSANGKRVQANLGAKNHAVLLPDAERAHALNALAGAAFGAAGQRCMALSALVAVGAARDWLPELAAHARRLRVNAGFEPDADVGPLISPQSRERVERIIQSAADEGATILLDGRGYKPEKYPNGNWVSWAFFFLRFYLFFFSFPFLFFCFLFSFPFPFPPFSFLYFWNSFFIFYFLSFFCKGRPHHHCRRRAAHDVLPRGDLRARARVPARALGRRRHGARQREPVRQRRRRLHAQRRRRRALPARRGRRAGGRQRAHPRAAAHVQLHGQQAQHRRRRQRQLLLRARGAALLHADQDGHEPVARHGPQLGRWRWRWGCGRERR
jgi:hypothetical protein